MSGSRHLDSHVAAELHNRLANQTIAHILDDPIAAGGSLSDVLALLESVVVGVLGSVFPLDATAPALAALATRVAKRLEKAPEINDDRKDGSHPLSRNNLN